MDKILLSCVITIILLSMSLKANNFLENKKNDVTIGLNISDTNYESKNKYNLEYNNYIFLPDNFNLTSNIVMKYEIDNNTKRYKRNYNLYTLPEYKINDLISYYVKLAYKEDNSIYINHKYTIGTGFTQEWINTPSDYFKTRIGLEHVMIDYIKYNDLVERYNNYKLGFIYGYKFQDSNNIIKIQSDIEQDYDNKNIYFIESSINFNFYIIKNIYYNINILHEYNSEVNKLNLKSNELTINNGLKVTF